MADTWTESLVGKWFGRDRTMLFFYVPQVAVYGPDPLRIRRGRGTGDHRPGRSRDAMTCVRTVPKPITRFA